MKKALVAIVGRPNVGKSTFFNRVCGRRISIVDDMAGVTRDRIYADAEWCGYSFTLVDTGGLDFENQGEIQRNILNQAQIAIDLADVILLFVDGKEGLTHSDMEVADFLRKSNKKIIVVVNKLDNNEVENTYEFYELGLGEPYGISSEQGKGLGDLLDEIVKTFKQTMPESPKGEEPLKIAIVGRPNAGKSSLVNKLLGEERVMVSSIAGTTRDAIDTPFVCDGKEYLLIDTAGMRKKNTIEKNSIERYSILRSLEAIKRADVVVVVIDSTEGICEQDIKVAGYVHEQGKPSVIVMNKWDIVEKDDKTINKYNDKLANDLKFMDYFVPVYISALTGQRVNRIMSMVQEVYQNASKRVTTGVLNEIIQDAITFKEPPFKNGKRLKILFATQVSTNPPNFVIFVNDASLMHFSYERYLENCLRKTLNLKGTPIKLTFKNREEKE